MKCPKCKEGELIMKDITYSGCTMTFFGCPNCNTTFYNNGWDLSEMKGVI